MALLSLTARHFRNLAAEEVPLAPDITLIIGPNAQGKTNFLEALLLLLAGISLRGQSDRDLVAWGQDGYRLQGPWMGEGTDPVEKDRLVTVNPLRRRESGPRIPAVAFAPDDLLLVKGSPEGRRRFLDEVAGQIRPRYLPELRRYQRALSQRNRALKSDAAHSVVESFGPLLAEAGSYVWRVRDEVVASLCLRLPDVLGALAPVDRMEITLDRGGHAATATATDFLGELERRRGEERLRGVTLTGPHRDDLHISVNGRAADVFASQGQQRSLALALKLASRDILEEVSGRVPVVLLDDVFSELDGTRRRALLELMSRSRQQTVVTDTDREDIGDMASLRYAVEAGVLRPVAR